MACRREGAWLKAKGPDGFTSGSCFLRRDRIKSLPINGPLNGDISPLATRWISEAHGRGRRRDHYRSAPCISLMSTNPKLPRSSNRAGELVLGVIHCAMAPTANMAANQRQYSRTAERSTALSQIGILFCVTENVTGDARGCKKNWRGETRQQQRSKGFRFYEARPTAGGQAGS